ncbi:hypothetical protein B0T24DRAFT_593242 [Lasiosphaeria ovina]|uniref:Uncharacterized protein n=1 Tax=Lasiosphaeria ovina TaxID=92902 RepID=A0AAE0KA38_9PEZI|nr:hypothetical protein B0T24DRAFT_593242 [Lasiosphaeria ovina]
MCHRSRVSKPLCGHIWAHQAVCPSDDICQVTGPDAATPISRSESLWCPKCRAQAATRGWLCCKCEEWNTAPLGSNSSTVLDKHVLNYGIDCCLGVGLWKELSCGHGMKL